MRLGLSTDALVDLDLRVTSALRGGDLAELDVLGGGDRRLLVGVTGGHDVPLVARRVALADEAQLEAFLDAIESWTEAVEAAGLAVLPTGRQALAPPDGTRVLWLVQPRIEASSVLPAWLETADEPLARLVLGDVLDATIAVTTAGVGLDARPSAWAWLEGELVYLDASRPEPASGALTPELRGGPLRPWARWLWPWLGFGAELDRSRTTRSAVELLLGGLQGSSWFALARALAEERGLVVDPESLRRASARQARVHDRLARARARR